MPLEEQFQHALLSAEEERQLAKRIEKGDMEARRRLIECNLRLVAHYVNKLTVEERHRDDLIQEGNVGLIIAVDKFDWRKGTKFSTYATWWIRQRIRKAMPGLNEIGRLPQHIWDKYWRYQKTGNPEVAEEDLDKAGRFLHAIVAVEDAVMTHEQEDLQIIIERRELIRRIEDVFECLEEKEQKALILWFGIGLEKPLSLAQVGRRIKKSDGARRSAEAVRQLIGKALRELRKLLDVAVVED